MCAFVFVLTNDLKCYLDCVQIPLASTWYKLSLSESHY